MEGIAVQLREVGERDLSALLALCGSALPLDAFSLRVLRSRWLGEPGHDPRLQLGAWDGDRLVGVMLGGVRAGGSGPVAALRLFAVETAYRRRGISAALLGELEDRLRARGLARVLVGNHAPIYLWPGLDVRYTPAYCFLEKHGYERSPESAVNMEVDLLAHDWDTERDEARLGGAGFVVRRLEPGDRDEFAAWLRSVWSETWECEALRSYENEPVSTWLATERGRIRAFASYNVTGFAKGFGPTGTEESAQGKGLGRVLFHRCMRDLREQGHETCEVCWVGPISYYARVADARITRVYWFLEKELRAPAGDAVGRYRPIARIGEETSAW